MKTTIRTIALTLILALLAGGALAEAPIPSAIPQMDSSTARVPITSAIQLLLRDEYGLKGPEPMCSKTHGAWLNLADGKADILFTVAPTAEEYQYFLDKGVGIELKVFGYDGLVFIGNAENPVDNLSAPQIREIYSGRITSWAQIPGGEDAPIDAYIRDAQSGSQRLFEQLVWSGFEMPDFAGLGFSQGEIENVASEFKITQYDSMDGIVVDGLAKHKNAIGYNIMSYVDEKFLNPPEPGEGGWWIVATGELNLRNGPGLGHKQLGSVAKGTKLAYLDEDSEDERGVYWYKVLHPDKGEVWVSSKYSDWEPVVASKIKLFSVDGFAPNTQHFASGEYPFVTTSIVAIRSDEPADSPARQLFDWIGSDLSRQLIEQNSTLAVAFSEPYEYVGE